MLFTGTFPMLYSCAVNSTTVYSMHPFRPVLFNTGQQGTADGTWDLILEIDKLTIERNNYIIIILFNYV